MRRRRATERPPAGVLAAMAISLTGTRVSAIALPWYVLATTGSAARTGLAAFCEPAPYVVAKALAGPAVDRAGPRRISWSADLVSAGAAAAVPLCHVSTGLPFGVLLVLVAVVGGARGPGDLAKEVMVPETPEAAERSGVPLPRAMGLSGAVERLASGAASSTRSSGATLVERVPRGMLGRVNALGDALAWAGVPLGDLAAGAALGFLPLAPVLVAGGLGYLMVTMVPVVRREWRELDARAVEAPSGG